MRELWPLNSLANLEYFKSGVVAAILYCSSTLLGQTGSPTEQAPLAERERALLKVNENANWVVVKGSTVDFGKSLLESATAQDVPSQGPPTQTSTPQWQYGGFIDLGYSLDFNHPENGIFLSRGTAWHVDEVDLNMAAAYVKKKASERSPWGAELTVQAGEDSEVFGFSATAPNLPGFK